MKDGERQEMCPKSDSSPTKSLEVRASEGGKPERYVIWVRAHATA